MENVTIQCPYCWQEIGVVVDESVKRQEYYEDCEVCCRSMRLMVTVDADNVVSIMAYSEDE